MKKLFASLAFLALFLSVGLADEVADAKQRIQTRQADVAALKASGTLGESNRGFLELRAADGAGAGQLAAGENHDREILYAVVAKRTGSTVDAVGRARAKEIAQSSRPGVWVQNEAGAWAKR